MFLDTAVALKAIPLLGSGKTHCVAQMKALKERG